MQTNSIDSAKRGRIILVSVIVTFLAFLIKISQSSNEIGLFQIFLNAGVVGVVTYFGLLWALRFQITLRALVYVISQPALITFVLTLFLQMFVFRRVGRVYEFLILILISILMFFATYASLLMANIFNVSSVKEIPLVQVGKTTSFILSIMSIFFSSYVILESQSNGYVTIILLSVMYFLIVLTHIRHLNIPRNSIWKSFSTIFVLLLISAFVQVIAGGNSLVSATVPTVIAYSLFSIMTLENVTNLQKFEYFAITLVAFFLNFFL
jgi:hypothetical protein